MEKQMIRLDIPVPPAPILEQAVGYPNTRNACYLALWWEPCGDEVILSDGLLSYTGLCWGYLAFVQHPLVQPHLAGINLGSSECSAEFHLIIDLIERQVFIASRQEANRLLAAQWEKGGCQETRLSLSPEDLQQWVENLEHQLLRFPGRDELMAQMAEDEQHIAVLEKWLDEQSINLNQKQGESE